MGTLLWKQLDLNHDRTELSCLAIKCKNKPAGGTVRFPMLAQQGRTLVLVPSIESQRVRSQAVCVQV